MYDPNKHGRAWSARWIWGSPPPLLCSFSCINSSSGEPERSVCQVLSPEKTWGKLNEAWTWEQPHLNFSRGCSQHIKGNISNVQNKWRDVKTPKDFPPPATLSCCHKSQDSCAHCCIQTGREKWRLSRARFYPHGNSVTVRRRLFISVLSSKCGLLVVSLPKAFQTWCTKQLVEKLKQLSIVAVRRVFLLPSMTVCL